MKKTNLIAACAAAALLAGCGALDVEQVKGTKAATGGTAFTQALFTEYKSLTTFEADRMLNWTSAYHYARKSLASARGEAVAADTTAIYPELPAAKAAELTDARGKLVAALTPANLSGKPQIAARAQAAFDCWMEQENEGWQTADIASCKGLFQTMLAQLTGPAAAPISSKEFVVYFAWDSARLDKAGLAVIDQAATEAKKTGSARLTLVGHADRSGAAEYNVRLSLRRADAVRGELSKRGIAQDRMSVTALGETEPAVPTKDGVREPKNRRVVIAIR